MRGKCEYWFLHTGLSRRELLYHQPVCVAGRCNISQFILAVNLMASSSLVSHDIIVRERMRITDNPYVLDYLYGCPPGTVFAYYHYFYDNPLGEGRNPHLHENIYGAVTFESREL